MKNFLLKHKKILLIWFLISTIVFVYEYSDNFTIPFRRKVIHQKIIIPPEFLNGDTLYIGDSFDRVSKFVKMEQFWSMNGMSSDRQYTPGYFWGNRDFFHLKFNFLNQLVGYDLLLSNQDSLPVKEYFVKTGKILIKYFGNNFKIYNRGAYKSARILYWDLPHENSIYLYGHINTANLNGEDSSGVSIEFNDVLPQKFYSLNTEETPKDLGLE